MTTPTFVLPETGPMLFADCPFCLAPLPVDLATGSLDCADCRVHLELAPEPVAVADLARRDEPVLAVAA